MDSKNNLSRITIDLSLEMHKQLKVKATLDGKSMRRVVLDLIEGYLNDTSSLQKTSTLNSLNVISKGD